MLEYSWVQHFLTNPAKQNKVLLSDSLSPGGRGLAQDDPALIVVVLDNLTEQFNREEKKKVSHFADVKIMEWGVSQHYHHIQEKIVMFVVPGTVPKRCRVSEWQFWWLVAFQHLPNADFSFNFAICMYWNRASWPHGKIIIWEITASGLSTMCIFDSWGYYGLLELKPTLMWHKPSRGESLACYGAARFNILMRFIMTGWAR